MEKKKPTLSEWLAFIAISISAIALILSSWQAFMFREHSQLSVRPVLDVEKQFFEEGYYHFVRIVIKNDGFGPAIVDSNLFVFDGKTIDELGLYGFIERLGFIRGCKISQIQAGTILKPGESIEILKFDTIVFRRTKHKKSSVKHRKFYNMDIQVQYRSLYGGKFAVSRKLEEIFPKHASWIDVL